MSKFYGDIEAFRSQLKRKRDRADRCWSCSAGDLLLGFNVRKDFRQLGLSDRGCEPSVTLCPRCAVEYMNSFMAKVPAPPGQDKAPPWTVQDYLEEVLGLMNERAVNVQPPSGR